MSNAPISQIAPITPIRIFESYDIADVTVEKVGENSYQATVETAYGPVPVRIPNLDDKPVDLSIDGWISRMTISELNAGKQVYFDIWNFHDGDDFNRQMYSKFDEELKNRQHDMVPSIGQLRFVLSNSKFQRFDGTKWNDINCDAYTSSSKI